MQQMLFLTPDHAGQRESANDTAFLIHGDSFRSVAGKVKTCFLAGLSQANPTVEMHGA
jgi:hypothetical protein